MVEKICFHDQGYGSQLSINRLDRLDVGTKARLDFEDKKKGMERETCKKNKPIALMANNV